MVQHIVKLRGRVEKAVEFKRGVAIDQGGNAAQVGPTQELVGQNNAFDAKVVHHLHLANGGCGNAPGPVCQLLGKYLRAHCRLAVGGK